MSKTEVIIQQAVLRNWGGKVITQTVAGTKTAGNNPNGMRLNPQLRKAAGALAVMRGDAAKQ